MSKTKQHGVLAQQDAPTVRTVLLYDTARLTRAELCQVVTDLHDISADNRRVTASSGPVNSPFPDRKLYEFDVGFPHLPAAQAFAQQAVQMLTKLGLPAIAVTAEADPHAPKASQQNLDAIARANALHGFTPTMH